MPRRPAYRPSLKALAALCAAASAIAFGSCSTSDAVRGTAPGGDEWRMFGGGPGRRNASASAVAPPLVREWEYDAGAGFGPASVAVAGGEVYVGTLAGELRVISLATGEETRGEALGEAIFGTPLVAGGRVIVALSASGENLRCYDAATGDVAWEVETGDIESSPLLLGGNVVVALVDGAVAAYDTADGKEIWFSPLPRSRGNPGTRSSPSSDGERIFACTDAGGVAALRPDDGTLLWTASAGGPVFGAVPAAEGRVFAATLAGTVRAFDAATGTTLWTHDAGAPIYGAVAVSAGAVVAGTSAGDLFALRPSDGSLLWRAKCAGGVGAAPLIAGGFVYAGDLGGQVAAFDLATGAEVWKETAGGRVRATPVAANGKLIVLAEDASVVCFGKPGVREGSGEREDPGGRAGPGERTGQNDGGGEKRRND